MFAAAASKVATAANIRRFMVGVLSRGSLLESDCRHCGCDGHGGNYVRHVPRAVNRLSEM
jgi:hypothetical protein